MKQFLLFCLAFGLLAGCKKSSDPPPFQSYLRMTIDGTRAVAANMNIKASTPISNPLLTISGAWANGSLYIYMYNFTLGETIVVPFPNPNIVRFSLYDPGLYYAGDNGISGTITGSGKIILLEISNEYVKGTFEFTTGIYNLNPQIRTVANGEFDIKRER